MAITPGSRIGPYEVTAQLGEGGMGVVFRGRDSRLQRDVALKLLPEHFANDADRLPRFEREAQVLASLNHPNIAQIYGLEQVNGSTCIVMELVEGETLEEKLTKGPLPADEAVGIAKQIADALAAAHERGIIHRDLKPANIKLTRNGTVKVLDFGLAKAIGPRSSDPYATTAATVAGGSLAGVIVGTPGYMSPEQARGKDVDSRTDIWAFGCVLFEMLTGRHAFTGETITDVLANIVSTPPDLDLLPKSTPSSIRLLLTSALNKNSSQRLQHIGDTRLFLDGGLASPTPTPVATTPRRPFVMALALAALVIVVAGVGLFATLALRSAPEPPVQMRFEIELPGLVGTPLVSPDGKWISYATQPANGKRVAWIRAIGSDSPQQIPGTENINGTIWSPDSRRLVTLADGTLRMFDVASGASRPLGSLGALRGGSWNRDGVLLLARASDNILVRLSESGGEMTPVTKLDAGRKETVHGLPLFLPDNTHFLYVSVAAKAEDSGIFRASLDGNESPTRLIAIQPNGFNGMAYAPSGHLLYLNEGRLSAQRVDAMGQPQGNAIVVADNVDGSFTASNTGLLFYHKAAPRAGRQLIWFSRDGKSLGQVGVEANYGNVDISPKGDRAAVDIVTNNNQDIWVVDLERSVSQPITFDPGREWTASWSPDGSRLAFASTRASNDGTTKIYEKSSTGTGTETVLPSGDVSSIPVNWSADGKYIVFSRLRQFGNTSGYDTWVLPTFGDRKPAPLLETGFDKFQARVSPNSNFVAYSTNESSTYQIVVQTFPDPSGGKWQITADGGVEPKWRRDGRELYYLSLDGKLMSVTIGGPAFTASRPVELFQTPLTVNSAQPTRDRRYDIAPDGRFLMVIPSATGAPTPYSVIVNWTAGLEK